MLPKISVLMSVYNGLPYLPESINSILNQTYTDFEFIIIDDSSTDDSWKILSEYAEKDKRIRLFKNEENLGLTKSLNKGLKLAQGKFIARMDDDDISMPERFAFQVEFLNKNPNVICVGGAFELIDEKGRLITCLKLPENDKEIQQKLLAGHTSICHPCAMIRRASIIKIGGYDEEIEMAQDLDLWLKLGEIGKLSNLKEQLLKYRLNTKSVSGQNQIKQRSLAKKICERAWQRRGLRCYFEAEEPWRPSSDPKSIHRFMLQYGWWAFNSGERQTAIIYGLKSVQALPFKPEGWKLLACALLKKLPTPTPEN